MTTQSPAPASTFSRSMTIAVSPRTVFAALTMPQQLKQWFAQHAEIEPRINGQIRFWGRHTIHVPTREDSHTRITHFEPDSLLAFDWTWAGSDDHVQIRVSPAVGGTLLALTHTRSRSGGDCDSVEDFWIVALGNLRSYLLEGAPTLLQDVSGRPIADQVITSIVINAPPHEVFLALTDPALLNRWIAKSAQVDLREGGDFSFGWTMSHNGVPEPNGPLKIRRIVPDRLLEHDWNYRPMPGSFVRWELEDLGGRTRVNLTHFGFTNGFQQPEHCLGWARYLHAMREICESGKAPPRRD